MAERALARYIPLVCGHMCPAEVEMLFRGLGGRGTVMCEKCGVFRAPVISESKGNQNYPDQPMF